jgi:sodium/proline symporter
MTPEAWKFAGVGVYLLILLGIGVVASRRMTDVKDYFAGGKDMGFWAVAFSARATGESSWLLLGLTGMGAMYGVRGFWVVLGEVLGVMGAWLFMSRRFKRLTDEYDSITIPDFLESHFRDGDQLLRRVAAAALVVFVTIYVSAQIDATGTAFESFLGVNYFVGAVVGFLVVMLYSTGGGFVAVVWSDVFQGTLMFFGLVALPIAGLMAMGGWGEMTTALHAADPALLAWGGSEGWTLLTVCSTIGLALIGIGFLGSPQVFVRFIALRDESEVPMGALVAFVWTLLADSGAVLVGMVGRALLTTPGQDVTAVGVFGKGAEAVLPQLVEATMPAALVGLYIAIVLSAIMSTVDSLLVVASSAAVRDWYQKVANPHLKDDELVRLSRWATLGLGLAAFAIAMTVAVVVEERTIFWFVIFGWSGIAATFCPTMILALFWRGFSRDGALVAMIIGFLCVPLFKFGGPLVPLAGPYLGELGELVPAFFLSMAAGVMVSFVSPGHRLEAG